MRIIHRSFFSPTLLALSLSTALLLGCGQTGPLYLPDKAKSETTKPTGKPALDDSAQPSDEKKTPDNTQTQ